LTFRSNSIKTGEILAERALSKPDAETQIMFQKPLIFTAIFVLLISFSACAPKSPDDFNAENNLYEYGMDLYKKKNYSQAVEFFDAFKNRYPVSPHITEIEYLLAESYYKKRDYIEAVYAFQNFRTLHPMDSRIPNAIFYTGMAYYKQVPKSVARDQTNATNCIQTLRDLLQKYPNFEDKDKAMNIYNKCRVLLAKREMYIAKFYMKQGSYNAAVGRLEILKKEYDFKELKQETLYRLAYSYYKLKNRDKTLENIDALIQMGTSSDYKKKAEKIKEKLN